MTINYPIYPSQLSVPSSLTGKERIIGTRVSGVGTTPKTIGMPIERIAQLVSSNVTLIAELVSINASLVASNVSIDYTALGQAVSIDYSQVSVSPEAVAEFVSVNPADVSVNVTAVAQAVSLDYSQIVLDYDQVSIDYSQISVNPDEVSVNLSAVAEMVSVDYSMISVNTTLVAELVSLDYSQISVNTTLVAELVSLDYQQISVNMSALAAELDFTTSVTPGVFGTSSVIPRLTINNEGRITSVALVTAPEIELLAANVSTSVGDFSNLTGTNVQEVLVSLDGFVQEVSASLAAITSTLSTYTTVVTREVGTSIGNLVEVVDVSGNAGLPAVDGSNLTNVQGRQVLLQAAPSVSAVAVDFAFVSGYSHFRIVIKRLSPDTNNRNILLQLSTDGGSSFKDQSNDYRSYMAKTSTSTSYFFRAADSGIALDGGGSGEIDTGDNLFAFVDIYRLSTVPVNHYVRGHYYSENGGAQNHFGDFMGVLLDVSVVSPNAVRLTPSGATAFATGEVYFYGIEE